MKNKLTLYKTNISNNTIIYNYSIEGKWKEAFSEVFSFKIDYSINLENIPISVAIIPFLANVLPMAWVYDAEVVVSVCDKDFHDCLEDVKRGYQEMYPMISFGGKLTVGKIEKNILTNQSGVCTFFSGGVDAFNTLTQHISENPTLITLWGADVELDDQIGWKNVERHLRDTCSEFNLNFVKVKSEFRIFLKEGQLGKMIRDSGDGWWHGFQHGIGIICHAAPIMYVLNKKYVYFASSFTVADKGKVTCASDPTIDNYIHFCGCDVSHDGYEYDRQMKIHNITEFSKNNGIPISLRVCWESKGGSNCCECEKCWRTIMGLYAEGVNPKEYGFDFSNEQLYTLSKKIKSGKNPMFSSLRYQSIQNSMKRNIQKNNLPASIRWFYSVNLKKYDKVKLYRRIWRKIYRIKEGKYGK